MSFIAGWLATAIALYGSYRVGNRCKLGFICQIVGSTLWAYVGYMHGPVSLIVVSLAFVVLYIRNYFRWHNLETKGRSRVESPSRKPD
jgi:hypothetical protein